MSTKTSSKSKQKRNKKKQQQNTNDKSTNNTNKENKDEVNIATNKKITDYFQIRKSERKCKTEIEKDKNLKIREAILNKGIEIETEGSDGGLIVKTIDENVGRGVFAAKAFLKDDFVVEYAGDLISHDEAAKREKKYSEETVGCYMYYFVYKSKKYCIDATAESGRLGRLLNHSKTKPNCHTKLFEVNSKPHLIIVASRDIENGEELLYDYGDRCKESLKAHPWLSN